MSARAALAHGVSLVPSLVGPQPTASPTILTAEDVRMATHDVAIRLPVVPTAEDVRTRLDAVAVRQSIVASAENVRMRLDGAALGRDVLAAEDVRVGG